MSHHRRVVDRVVKQARKVARLSYHGKRGGLTADVSWILSRRSLGHHGSLPGGIREALRAIVLRYAETVAATPVRLSWAEWRVLKALPQPLVTVSDLWDALLRVGHADFQQRLQVRPPAEWMVILDHLAVWASTAVRKAEGRKRPARGSPGPKPKSS